MPNFEVIEGRCGVSTVFVRILNEQAEVAEALAILYDLLVALAKGDCAPTKCVLPVRALDVLDDLAHRGLTTVQAMGPW